MFDLSFARLIVLECDNDHRNVSMGCFLVISVTSYLQGECVNLVILCFTNMRGNRDYGMISTELVVFKAWIDEVMV
ncbi:hypothetical protein EDB67_11276 [Vibrio crassostreae]|nr:hypothetical protein EDB67_11276 [Vibrio crassostreae]TCN89124.1 hypothetical protein EDB37_100674 [Vibrio crassostreae]TCV23235.1 hypothetical protein EDB71_11476 [Vibrio crassostreae]